MSQCHPGLLNYKTFWLCVLLLMHELFTPWNNSAPQVWIISCWASLQIRWWSRLVIIMYVLHSIQVQFHIRIMLSRQLRWSSQYAGKTQTCSDRRISIRFGLSGNSPGYFGWRYRKRINTTSRGDKCSSSTCVNKLHVSKSCHYPPLPVCICNM